MAADLYINYQRVDLTGSEQVALSYAVNRLTDIESRQGFYSNTFSLPDTHRNRELFGLPHEMNSLDVRRFARLAAHIEADGVPVMQGFAELRSAGESLEVFVIAGNANWIADISGKHLSDLDMSDIDHVVTPAFVQSNRFNDSDDLYVYPDVDYGVQQFLNGWIPAWYLRPALFLRGLITRIFNQAGWTISANEVDGDTTYREMLLPYVNEQQTHSAAWVASKEFTVEVEPFSDSIPFGNAKRYAVGFDTVVADNGSQFTLGTWAVVNTPAVPTPLAFYTPNEEIKQNFKLHLEFDVANWSSAISYLQIYFANANYGVRFYDNDFQFAPQGVNELNGVQYYSHFMGGFGNGSFSIDIETGDMRGCDHQAVMITAYLCDIDITAGILTTVVSDERLHYSHLDMASAAPKVKQTDLVKYFVNAFQLQIVADSVNREVSFTRLDAVRSNPPDDWSALIDLSEKPVHTFRVADFLRDNILKYKTDSADRGLLPYPELGWHTISNTALPVGEKTIYEAPFALTTRQPAHHGTKELALIELHKDDKPETDVLHIALTVLQIGNGDGNVAVVGGALALTVGTKVTYFGGSAQTVDGYDIDRQSFTVTEVLSDVAFVISPMPVGTPLTLSGTMYAGMFDRYICVADPAIYEAGDEIVVHGAGAAGVYTIYGSEVMGRSLFVESIEGQTITVDESMTSAAPNYASKKVIGCKGWKSPASTPPRIATHRTVTNSGSAVSIIGQAAEVDGSEVYHSFIHWDVLAALHWQTITAIIARPEMVRMLLRLSAADINQLDFTRPKFIGLFQAYFLLSFVEQFRADVVSSTSVELVKIPMP